MSAADDERALHAFTREYCKHPKSEIRRFTVSGGGEQARKQCLVCGVGFGPAVSKDKALYAKLSDDLLNEEYLENQKNKERALRDAVTDARREEYNTYLKTPEWAALRAKVLERDHYLCQGCLAAKATLVHHFTYANVGNELCFELVALCHECHARAHGKDQ